MPENIGAHSECVVYVDVAIHIGESTALAAYEADWGSAQANIAVYASSNPLLSQLVVVPRLWCSRSSRALLVRC